MSKETIGKTLKLVGEPVSKMFKSWLARKMVIGAGPFRSINSTTRREIAKHVLGNDDY